LAIKAVLFDLDGTLADTAKDLAASLNRTLRHFKKDPLPFETIRPFVSKGAPGMIKLAFGLNMDDANYESVREIFLNDYAEHLCDETTLFDGLEECLTWMENHQIAWGIITNKPTFLAEPLFEQMQLSQRSAVSYCGDTFSEKKPHPLPLLNAAEHIKLSPEDCIYVGDDERDILAANSAGMISVAALWGYIPPEDNPEKWPSDYEVKRSEDLLSLVQQLSVP